MAAKKETKAVVLEVLNRHLRDEPHVRAEITINEAKHEIVSSELDFLVKDDSSSLIAARVILTLRDISGPDGDKPTTEPAAHIITTTTTTSPDPSSPSTTVILDDTPTPTPPHRASTIPTHPFSTSTAGHHKPLAETYRAYIATFMAAPAQAVATLPRFLHQPVTHNRRPLSVPEYHGLVQAVRAAIPDIGTEIVGLLADEGRGVVAARLEFAGTLVEPFAGVEPPADGGGLPVGIGEIVFYWFEAGRIREVVSLVDLKGLGASA